MARRKPLDLDNVGDHLDIVSKVVRKLVPHRPTMQGMDCDIQIHDWMVAWNEHRSFSTAIGYAQQGWDYFGGLNRYLRPDDDHEDDHPSHVRAREAAAKALELLGLYPEARS